MQLVLKSNRIVAHGENFLSMGDFVINIKTGIKYENATIAECNGCPSDIDSVGYEYHAGNFVSCAPYGTSTSGNVAVLCSRDCKSIKDSLIPFGRMGQIEELTYNGTNTSNIRLTFNAIPKMIFLIGKNKQNNNNHNIYFSIITNGVGLIYKSGELTNHITTDMQTSNPSVYVNGKTLNINANPYEWFNSNQFEYRVIALTKGGE